MLFLAEAAGPGGGSFIQLIIPFALMFGIMYFLMIRPQKKKEKERKESISRVRRNDKVVTSGGIHGKVLNVKENIIILNIDDKKEVTMKIDKNAISTVVPSEEEE